MSEYSRHVEVGFVQVAFSGVIIVLLVLLGLTASTTRGATVTSTSTDTQTETVTTTSLETATSTITPAIASAWASSIAQVMGSPCDNITGSVSPPPFQVSYYYFLINVDYPGQWGGVASVDNGTSAPFTSCYTGNGDGVVVYHAPAALSLNSNSTLQFTVTKLDGSAGSLVVTFDSVTNSTSAAYGHVTLGGTPFHENGE